MESKEEVQRAWKRLRQLRSRLLGSPHRITAAEISDDGEVRVTSSLVSETKSVGDWDPPELAHWLEHTDALVRSLDARDKTDHTTSWLRLLTFTRARKAKFWGLGIRTTAATAAEDHATTLTLISSFSWLVRSPEIGGSGSTLAEIWREFLEEAGGQAANIRIQTPERLKALKKAGAAASGGGLTTSHYHPTPAAGPAAAASSSGPVWGPEPGLEPTP
eukprot:CAMPEP_0181329878 /NCGR_PEP_ID=MMETSP1101-20121128/23568_1 /TAXON_ID=46948 /ORGANISM="Rhodomonas abbreviata, Strain Caron Lab Isolate" /LENGTH=217 /DNA_ID=CAMNT_0023439031 /DNA_START=1 /DNA_END=650 /DNA_ORIENTATION=+